MENEINLAPDFIDRTIDTINYVFNIFHYDHLPFFILAIVPALIWLYILLRHQRENIFSVVTTFIAGMLTVIPVFIFQHEISRIENWFDSLSCCITAIVLSGLWIGLYEETVKHWIVKITDRRLFRNIDDAIQFSIIAALGFAFCENILYFRSIWDNPAIGSFWFYFTFRSFGSMLLHIFASGIFGYYYGIARFASPILRDGLAKGKKFAITKKIHQIFHLKSNTIFFEEKVLEGLLIATLLHGAFDIMMGMSQYAADNGSTSASKLWLLISVPFLVGGYFWLTALLDRKENHKIYGNLLEKDVLDEEPNKITDR